MADLKLENVLFDLLREPKKRDEGKIVVEADIKSSCSHQELYTFVEREIIPKIYPKILPNNISHDDRLNGHEFDIKKKSGQDNVYITYFSPTLITIALKTEDEKLIDKFFRLVRDHLKRKPDTVDLENLSDEAYFAHILLRAGCVNTSLNDVTPYKIIGEEPSPLYINVSRVLAYPIISQEIISHIAAKIGDLIPREDYVVLGGGKAVPFAKQLADEFAIPHGIIRDNGNIDGAFVSEKQVIILEDVVALGNKLRNYIQAVKSKRGIPCMARAIMDLGIRKSGSFFDLNYNSLTTLKTLLSLSPKQIYASGMITNAELEESKHYVNNREAWVKEHKK